MLASQELLRPFGGLSTVNRGGSSCRATYHCDTMKVFPLVTHSHNGTMHRFNKLYGYGPVLRSYCGEEPDRPIWGEVQHSLFMNTHHFDESGRLGPLRDQAGRFPKLLSWQEVLPFPHQVAIGIPVAYLLEGQSEVFALPKGYEHLNGKDFVLVMPRMDKDITLDKRIFKYRALVHEGLSQDPGRHLVFALHPKDAANKEILEKEFGQVGEFVWRGKVDPITDLKESLALMQHADEVWSNYFGAHVFQAAAFYRSPTRLLGNGLFKDVYHENMNHYLHAFHEAHDNIDTQVEVAKEVLGLQHVRPVDELRDILGFTRAKRVFARPVSVAYRRLRRVKVHWRVARGRQSPRGSDQVAPNKISSP